jgi:hypothetical protein
MRAFKLYILILLLPHSIFSWGQTESGKKLSKLEIVQEPFTNYFDKNGRTIGCDWNLECTDFDVIFYSVEIDQSKREIKVQGRTYLSSDSRVDSMDKVKHGDTVGQFSVQIFLAKPYKHTLIEVPGMSFISKGYGEIEYAKFPFREGDFNITLKVDADTRLYFVGFNQHLKEYDIGQLMR